MAETLRELVVALSLYSSNFSRNMRTINAQIKEAEPTFRLAGAGVQNFEKTVAGTEAKLSMLGQKLTQQNRAVEQYSRALVAANDKLKENYDQHKDYSARLEQAKARQEALRFEVETSKVAYEHYPEPSPLPSTHFHDPSIVQPVPSRRHSFLYSHFFPASHGTSAGCSSPVKAPARSAGFFSASPP